MSPYSVDDEYNQQPYREQYDDNGQYNVDGDNNNYPDSYQHQQQQHYLPPPNEAIDNYEDVDSQHQYTPYEPIDHDYNADYNAYANVGIGIDNYPSTYQSNNYQPNNYQPNNYQTDYKSDYTPQSYTITPYVGINQYPQFKDDDDNIDNDYNNNHNQYEPEEDQQQHQSIFPQFNDDSLDSPGIYLSNYLYHINHPKSSISHTSIYLSTHPPIRKLYIHP